MLHPVPRAAEPPDLPQTYQGIVYPWHMDHMGHMNVQHYVGMFDQSTWVLFGMLGVDSSFMYAQRCGMAALEQHLTYRRELHSGDRVEIRSGLLEIKDKTVRFFHRMLHLPTGTLAASAVLTGVCLHMDTRRSQPLPDFVRVRGASLIAPESAVLSEA